LFHACYITHLCSLFRIGMNTRSCLRVNYLHVSSAVYFKTISRSEFYFSKHMPCMFSLLKNLQWEINHQIFVFVVKGYNVVLKLLRQLCLLMFSLKKHVHDWKVEITVRSIQMQSNIWITCMQPAGT
jgi:hypothetical protein